MMAKDLFWIAIRLLLNQKNLLKIFYAGHAVPDDSESDDDSSSSPRASRLDSEGGMAVPDQDEDSPAEERERPPKEPKKPREPDFGTSILLLY